MTKAAALHDSSNDSDSNSRLRQWHGPLFPRSGDVIHPQLWESGSGYETRGGGGGGEVL